MDVVAWLALAVGAGSLALGSYNTVVQRRTRTPRLGVTARYADETTDHGAIVAFLVIEAVNVGDVPTTLTEVGVVMDGEELVPEPLNDVASAWAPLPHELLPAQRFRQRRPIGRLAHLASERGVIGNVHLRAFYRDYKGTRYKAAPLELDVDHWTELPKVG